MERYAHRCLLEKKGVGYIGKVYVGFYKGKDQEKKGKQLLSLFFKGI
jgi:hypothetical protein